MKEEIGDALGCNPLFDMFAVRGRIEYLRKPYIEQRDKDLDSLKEYLTPNKTICAGLLF